MHDELKPCPCGEMPERLCINRDHDRTKWAHVCGSCCGFWEIEFRAQYAPPGPELDALALEAWNDAPRGNNDVTTREVLNELYRARPRELDDD